MSLWINDPAKDSKFHSLSPGDWSNLAPDSAIHFSEAVILPFDGGYQLMGYVHHAIDVKRARADRYTFEPCFCKILFRNKEYEKRTKEGDEWKTVKVPPSSYELFWCQIFDKLQTGNQPEGCGFSGWIRFRLGDATQEIILKGTNPNGKMLSDEVRQQFADEAYCIQAQNLDKLKGLDLSKELPEGAKKGGGSWGSSKGQTEKERLQDRLDFVLAQCGEYCEDCKNLADVALVFTAPHESLAPQITELKKLIQLVLHS